MRITKTNKQTKKTNNREEKATYVKKKERSQEQNKSKATALHERKTQLQSNVLRVKIKSATKHTKKTRDKKNWSLSFLLFIYI